MKRNIYYIMAIGVFILVLSGSAYAYYLSSATEKDKIVGNSANPALTVDVEEITKTESLLIPMSEEVLDKAISHSPQCIDDNGNEVCDIYRITVTNTGDASLYSTVNITLNGSTLPNLKWIEVNSNSLKDNAMEHGLGKNNLVMNDVIGIGKNKVYYIMVYINDSGILQSDNGAYSGVVDVNGATTKLNNKAYATLTRLGLEVDTTHTPDFSTVSGNNGVKIIFNDDPNLNERLVGQGDGTNGIYASEDDFGTSYYFRGAVENNYVKFAGYYWRIIRINGDGSVRMIYAGNSAHENGYDDSTFNDMSIGTSAYNLSNNDNTYVGYTYGTVGSSLYEETHKNTAMSEMYRKLYTWYKDYLNDYTNYLQDTIYCNDRSVASASTIDDVEFNGNGAGTTNTAYSSLYRNLVNHNPNLKCANLNDRFTVSTDNGNGKLIYPVGLITTDEAILAGGVYYFGADSIVHNLDYYLYNATTYWSMTPSYFMGIAYMGVIEGNVIEMIGTNNELPVRPVISLKSDAIDRGSGTINDPFRIDKIDPISVEPS